MISRSVSSRLSRSRLATMRSWLSVGGIWAALCPSGVGAHAYWPASPWEDSPGPPRMCV